MSAGPSLRLVPKSPPSFPVCRDTVEALEQLLIAARAGHVVGAVFGVALLHHHYMVNACGTFSRDPVLGRGVVAALDDEMRRLVDELD